MKNLLCILATGVGFSIAIAAVIALLMSRPKDELKRIDPSPEMKITYRTVWRKE